jgi:hypothetical protein
LFAKVCFASFIKIFPLPEPKGKPTAKQEDILANEYTFANYANNG